MKKIVQIYPENRPDLWLEGWQKWADKVIILDDPYTANPEIPFVFGGNMVYKWVRNWMANRYPCIVTNRPFLGGHLHKKRTSWRASVNSFANTQLNNIPYSRWNTIGLDRQPWKVTEVKNVLIAPPRKTLNVWVGKTPEEWSAEMSSKFPGANIRVRLKEGMKGKGGRYSSLWDDLDWADLVVSYSSAVTAEAFWYGKKAISLGVCPTWISSYNQLENWQDPTEPSNRNLWHEHMSWIQYTEDEWASGEAQELIYQYQGWPLEVQTVDNPFIGK